MVYTPPATTTAAASGSAPPDDPPFETAKLQSPTAQIPTTTAAVPPRTAARMVVHEDQDPRLTGDLRRLRDVRAPDPTRGGRDEPREHVYPTTKHGGAAGRAEPDPGCDHEALDQVQHEEAQTRDRQCDGSSKLHAKTRLRRFGGWATGQKRRAADSRRLTGPDNRHQDCGWRKSHPPFNSSPLTAPSADGVQELRAKGKTRFRKLFHLRPSSGWTKGGDPAPSGQRVDPERPSLVSPLGGESGP